MMTLLQDDAPARELRDAVATLEIPPLAADAFARIVARRAEGERISLRTEDASPRLVSRGVRTGVIVLGVLAASVLVMVLTRRPSPAQTSQAIEPFALAAVDSACANAPTTTSDSSALRHLMISAFGIPAACGAEPGQDPPISYRASQIAAGAFTYSGYTITDGVFTSTQNQLSTDVISRVAWKGKAAILAVRHGALITGVHLDSLIVSADGPIPLYFASRYTTQHPEGTIHADFDSSTISISTTGRLDTTARFQFRMKPGQLPFGFATTLAVPALPLANGWHGVIEVAPPIHPRASRYFLRPWEAISLRVVGREKIHVPAGDFECWKVQIGDSKEGSYLWVSNAHHLVIQSVSVSRFGDTSFEDHRQLERMILTPH